MIIGFILLAATFGLFCGIVSLLMAYGLLFAFCCYVGGGFIAFCLIVFYRNGRIDLEDSARRRPHQP